MNAANALPRRWTGLGVLLGGLVLILAVVGGKKKADPPSAAELVDAIVNRNKPPKLVHWSSRDRWDPSEAVLFPEDHDWKEEGRARKAVDQLRADQTEEGWEELVRRIDDRRYSVTQTTPHSGYALTSNVGDICRDEALSRLVHVYWQHLPLVKGKFNEDVRLRVNVLEYSELPRWRKERAARSLYELQIEVCQMAIEALSKAEGATRAQKDQAREKIEAQIARLKRTKRPVHRPYDGPLDEGLHYRYDADVAKRVREGIESGKYGPLGIWLGLYK